MTIIPGSVRIVSQGLLWTWFEHSFRKHNWPISSGTESQALPLDSTDSFTTVCRRAFPAAAGDGQAEGGRRRPRRRVRGSLLGESGAGGRGWRVPARLAEGPRGAPLARQAASAEQQQQQQPPPGAARGRRAGLLPGPPDWQFISLQPWPRRGRGEAPKQPRAEPPSSGEEGRNLPPRLRMEAPAGLRLDSRLKQQVEQSSLNAPPAPPRMPGTMHAVEPLRGFAGASQAALKLAKGGFATRGPSVGNRPLASSRARLGAPGEAEGGCDAPARSQGGGGGGG